MQTEIMIGVIDCNNFFVSCERLFRPDLRNRPVVVLSSNDGCVVARSQEIKDKGIPMGVPYFQIKDILQECNAAVFSSNFPLYRDLSRRVFEVVRGVVSHFEQYSIDEGFFIVSIQEAEQISVKLRAEILRLVGMPVSVGVGFSKTQAKFANAVAKKTTGVHVLSIADWNDRVATIRLGEIWGVGGRRAQAFTAHGLGTVADLLQADLAAVARLFGVEGVRLRAELAGTVVYAVTSAQPAQKSIMSSRSFTERTHSLAVVQDAVAYHVRCAVEDLRVQGKAASRCTVFMSSSRYEVVGPGRGVREIKLTAPAQDVFTFLKIAKTAVEVLYDPSVAYKKVGFLLSSFTPLEYVPCGLFEVTTQGTAGATEALVASIVSINNRYGRDTVRVGGGLQEASWQVRQEALSPAYTTRWSDLPQVRA